MGGRRSRRIEGKGSKAIKVVIEELRQGAGGAPRGSGVCEEEEDGPSLGAGHTLVMERD